MEQNCKYQIENVMEIMENVPKEHERNVMEMSVNMIKHPAYGNNR